MPRVKQTCLCTIFVSHCYVQHPQILITQYTTTFHLIESVRTRGHSEIPSGRQHAKHPCDVQQTLRANNNIVDWYVYQLYKEADKTHDRKADSGCHSNFLELFPIWFCATFDEPNRVFGKLFCRIDVCHYLIHL